MTSGQYHQKLSSNDVVHPMASRPTINTTENPSVPDVIKTR